ncbi:MAG: DUF1549 and DUF1553 domain-containing protein [Bryobacteraceae bacterium]|nr:DUF1549 and DUF1553 domain-containing protein [Bryobacteraceae bacterium]
MRSPFKASKLILPGLVLVVCCALWGEQAPTFKPQHRRWWAIQPVQSTAIPAADIGGGKWARTEIDRFVWDKLKAKGLQPSPAAPKEVFLRRVTLDLTGLPPTPEEMQAFLTDERPGAEERVVDRLLASPRYGERWGRHWLDVVRYSDSDGFKQDDTRPNMWRYRDWVIGSFNKDKPYDRFVKEQIAGDELYPGDKEALVGVGYLRLFEDEFNQAHIRLRRQELLNDVTDNTAYAFLGVTLGCARCHDHKFDALLHRDYYRLQSFFANLKIEDAAPLASAQEIAQYDSQMAKYREAAKPVLDKIDAFLAEPRAKYRKEYTERFPEEVQAVIYKKPEARSPLDWQVYHKAITQVEVPDSDIIAKKLDAKGKLKYKALTEELAAFKDLLPKALPVAQVMRDQAVEAPDTFVLLGGALDSHGPKVEPGFLSILDPGPAAIQPLPELQSSGRRSALANWLADAKNPLSTRVIVNRVWHYHFGRGIVGTPNDFGVMGERPVNRELLDWLTATFTGADQWSIKKLHRRIVLSATYRQSSDYREDAATVDSDNKLLWRYPRRRLEGEAIRDSMLQVSGLLDRTMGGPGVFPKVPAGTEIQEGRHWRKSTGPADEYRASVYTFSRRLVRYPMLQSFDAPLALESCGRRQETVTPDQALELMNGEATSGFAHALAKRISDDAGQSPGSLVDRAFRLAMGRAPRDSERKRALEFLQKQTAVAGGQNEALADLALSLLSSSEFIYVD